jgi:micrococcal nuclease
MTKLKLLITLLTILFSVSISFAWQGKVVKVTDGDTVTVLNIDKKQVKVRLYGVDAPELKQSFGIQSKEFLSCLILGKPIKIENMGVDVYGRVIGKIFHEGNDISIAMCRSGNAWWFKKYAGQNIELKEAEELAKRQELGLWRHHKPLPPWEYRKLQRKK